MSNLQNTEILEKLYEEEYEAIYLHILNWSDEDWKPTTEDKEIMHEEATKRARKRFEELPEPGDYDD